MFSRRVLDFCPSKNVSFPVERRNVGFCAGTKLWAMPIGPGRWCSQAPMALGLSPREEGSESSEWKVCLGHRLEALFPAPAIMSLPLLQYCFLRPLSNHYPRGAGSVA